MADNQLRDFLSLPPRDYPSDDEIPNPIQPALDTLFSQFARRPRSPSPATFLPASRASARPRSGVVIVDEPSLDLRALDYTAEYDSHLMCPICHVPFIDPVVLDCDHTFCASCYDEYRNGASSSERSQCPSCRSYVLSSPKKASRLISNMCDDIKVRCPNEPCITVIARGYMERHVAKDCLEQPLRCSDPKCAQQTKRKNYIPGQCIHNSHIECDCGAVIELGRGEWLKHKDEDCPNTGVKCEKCSGRIPVRDYLSGSKEHDCQAEKAELKCPGEEFGCGEEIDAARLEQHVKGCPLAKLAPYLTRQSRIINSLSEQLAQSKMRNDIFQTGLERIDDLLSTQIQPKLAHVHVSEPDTDQDHDVEEIERDHIPSAASFHQQHGLLLPAHVRDLTPSPTFSQSQSMHHQVDGHHYPTSSTTSTGSSSSHQYIMNLHESLRTSITSLETDIHNLHNNLAEVDARTSMQIMNETLRLKEELAHTSAALFSTRAQVQWLLNRERMGMGMNMNMNMMRGRQPSVSQQNQAPTTEPQHQDLAGQNSNRNETAQEHESASEQFPSLGGHTSARASLSSSPIYGAATETETRRPSIRRHSGGSQERVKL